MKYKIDILISANIDFFEICENLATYGKNSTILFTDSFSKFLASVLDMPLMFPQYARKPKYRKAQLVYEYMVFYKVDKKSKTVKVSRILHGKQNIDDKLL